jgi:hypothetical protein
MDVAERIDRLVGDSTFAPYIEEFLKEVRSNWRDAEASLKRCLVWIALLAIAFELLRRGGLAELSVGFIQISEPKVLQQALPIGIAYQISSLGALISDVFTYREIHLELIDRHHNILRSTELDRALQPANSLIFSQEFQADLSDHVWAAKFTNVVMILRVLVVILLPVLFEIYAYFTLFSSLGVHSIPTWIGCVLSSILTGAGFISFANSF